MNKTNQNDYKTTRIILETSNSLRINDIVDILHNKPEENGDVEFLPIILTAKDCLERTLRCFVLLGTWTNEENTKTMIKSNETMSKTGIKGLNSNKT